MKYYRSLALAASLAAGVALPALAQTPATPAPAAATATKLPDAGVKKAAPATVKHVHHVSRHKAATPARKR